MYNILVTGVGAIIGYGIIDSLKKSKYNLKIVGMDIYNDAIGKQFVDCFEQAILASDSNYLEFLKSIIIKYSIDLVFFSTEQEIDRVINNQSFFSELNVKFVLNSSQLHDIAKDKWMTYLKLKQYKFATIRTCIEGEFNELSEQLGIPMLLKPRNSYASKGICKIYDSDDLSYWKRKLQSNFMVQQIVGDINCEYTAATFGLGDGKCSGKIILNRKLSGEGATAKAKVVYIKQLEDEMDKLVEIFKPTGPTNFQFMFHNDKFLLLEINPRISSSVSIRSAFGYNEAEMCIRYYLENEIPTIECLKDGTAIRYIKDFIIYDSNNI